MFVYYVSSQEKETKQKHRNKTFFFFFHRMEKEKKEKALCQLTQRCYYINFFNVIYV
jgi:hypothetical protein